MRFVDHVLDYYHARPLSYWNESTIQAFHDNVTKATELDLALGHKTYDVTISPLLMRTFEQVEQRLANAKCQTKEFWLYMDDKGTLFGIFKDRPVPVAGRSIIGPFRLVEDSDD